MAALLPKSPVTVGIGEAEPTGVGTAGAEAGVDAEDPAGDGDPLLHAASRATGSATSNPAIRRTAVLTVGRS
ncbi:hypothetical protein GCM10009760_34440 [Kitasatospora kazusensis]|uniref:Uncharacterized protein n=1 Tax=Kitasatospora kazusensis TaxID=407974 RepID=A0ABP5LFQ3_9ACTN